MGIEPTYSAWEADVLPLNYTRELDAFAVAYRARIISIPRYRAVARDTVRTPKPIETR